MARLVETRTLSEVFGLCVGCRICLLCHMCVHLSGMLVGLLFSLVGVGNLEDETERFLVRESGEDDNSCGMTSKQYQGGRSTITVVSLWQIVITCVRQGGQ